MAQYAHPTCAPIIQNTKYTIHSMPTLASCAPTIQSTKYTICPHCLCSHNTKYNTVHDTKCNAWHNTQYKIHNTQYAHPSQLCSHKTKYKIYTICSPYLCSHNTKYSTHCKTQYMTKYNVQYTQEKGCIPTIQIHYTLHNARHNTRQNTIYNRQTIHKMQYSMLYTIQFAIQDTIQYAHSSCVQTVHNTQYKCLYSHHSCVHINTTH